jgi:hypothetical protein
MFVQAVQVKKVRRYAHRQLSNLSVQCTQQPSDQEKVLVGHLLPRKNSEPRNLVTEHERLRCR